MIRTFSPNDKIFTSNGDVFTIINGTLNISFIGGSPSSKIPNVVSLTYDSSVYTVTSNKTS